MKHLPVLKEFKVCADSVKVLLVSVKDFRALTLILCVLCVCVCASRGKYTLRDTLSQSQCYASSKNSSSLATSEPPTLPAHRLATKNLFSQRKQFQSPSPISHGFSKCSFRTLFWQECMIFVLYVFSSFVVKLHMVIMLTNSSKKNVEGRKKNILTSQAVSVECTVETHTHTQ